MAITKTYEYRLINEHGKKAKGTIDAANEAAAVHQLRQQGVVPVSLTEAGKGLNREISIPGLGGGVKLKELAVFARQFATMTTSGMSLLRSLGVLEEQAGNAKLKRTISEVRADIEGGLSLSAALGKHDKVFPTLMVAMVRAGEAGGFLDNALDRVAVTFEKDADLRAKIKSAMTYPVIVLLFTAVLVSGVLLFIVPIFQDMFVQLGGELPLPTRIIVAASESLVWTGPLGIALLVGGTILFRRELRRRPSLRVKFDQFKLRLPVIGPMLSKLAISRFSRNLGTLLGVGVPVLGALDVVGETTGNAVIAATMKELQQAVRDGQPMSAPLAKHPLFPQMVAQMVEVGEESGQISQMLDKIADFYDREVDSATEALTAAIEPIMVVVMGLVVGGMVLCLYLPMFTIYENIQQ